MREPFSQSQSVRFCGFGGQGIILSAMILGEALVVKRGLYASQTQSYGSEARGGQCQAELMISTRPVLSPMLACNDILVAMSPQSLKTYIGALKERGKLFVDSALVSLESGERERFDVFAAPFVDEAVALGSRMSANMVMLGYFVTVTGFLECDQLKELVREKLNKKFWEVNAKCIDRGHELATKRS